jgi:hypothetical protein
VLEEQLVARSIVHYAATKCWHDVVGWVQQTASVIVNERIEASGDAEFECAEHGLRQWQMPWVPRPACALVGLAILWLRTRTYVSHHENGDVVIFCGGVNSVDHGAMPHLCHDQSRFLEHFTCRAVCP